MFLEYQLGTTGHQAEQTKRRIGFVCCSIYSARALLIREAVTYLLAHPVGSEGGGLKANGDLVAKLEENLKAEYTARTELQQTVFSQLLTPLQVRPALP